MSILGKKHDGEVQTSKYTWHFHIFKIESAKKKFEYIKPDVEQVGWCPSPLCFIKQLLRIKRLKNCNCKEFLQNDEI